MEAPKAKPERELSPCYKKKAEDAGFLANAKDHFEQFKSTPVDRHWICLKNTMRKAGDYVRVKKQSTSLFESSKVGGESGTGVKEAASSAAVQSQ
ncbi:uncharacterized protein [Typha latifolia]|uniref:uncharacterized protein isoform X1 n=1 Tax=Typha latifolia TaxID=4733 RepID=UPI003C2BCA55